MNGEKDLQFNQIVDAYVTNNPRFLHRQWLADEINERLNRRDKKFILLTAEPGMGKSTFMAQLAYDNPVWLRYFIRRDQISGLSTVGARSFLMRLGFQLEKTESDSINNANKHIENQQTAKQTTQGSEILGLSVKRLKASPFYQQILLKVSQSVKKSGGQMTGVQIDTLIADPLLLPLKDLQETALFEPARQLAQSDDKMLVILIDALDELRYAHSKDDILEWLIGINPDDLPDNIRFVLSSRPPDDRLNRLIKNQGARLSHLKLDHHIGENKGEFQQKLDEDTGAYVKKLLSEVDLTQYWTEDRTAEAWSQTAVLKAEGNLGYMDMIARGLDHSISQGATERVLELLDMANLPDELGGLYTFFLNQIKVASMQEHIQRNDPQSGDTFFVNPWSAVYRRLLSIMTVAFEPLTEEQWFTLSNVQDDINKEATKQAIGNLNPFLDVEEFLDADGNEKYRYRFYHSTLPEFLGNAELEESQNTAGFYAQPQKAHQRISRYYYYQFAGRRSISDDYGLHHLPAHLSAATLIQELDTLLVDFDWLQTKLTRINILELLDDYDFLDAKGQDDPVILVQKALRLSAHVLAVDAAQLTPQLVGRLHGFDDPALQTLLKEATTHQQETTWLRPLHTTLTPPGDTLLRTLTGHTAAVNDMVTIPKSHERYIISASDDKTLKVWDLDEDVEAQKTLRGHKERVTAVAVMPNGKQAISYSDDQTIKVWNLEDESETESASYDIGTALIKPMAVTCTGQIVGTTQDNEGSQFVKMWQLPGNFEPCEDQTNSKEDSFAKRLAKGLGSIAIPSFIISILFLWFIEELPTSFAELDNLGITFIICFLLIGFVRLILRESNDIEVIDLPLKHEKIDKQIKSETDEEEALTPNPDESPPTSKKNRFAKAFGFIVILPFLCTFCTLMFEVSPEDEASQGFGVTYIAFVILAAILYLGWRLFQSVNVDDNPNNDYMNRSRKKIGSETAKRAKDIILRLFGVITILFGIVVVSQIGSISQEDTEVNLFLLAFLLFLIFTSWYTVKVTYTDENVDSIAIWLKEKQVVTVARNHTIKARNLYNRGWKMTLHGRLIFKFAARLKPISAMAISSDGNYVVHASDDSLATRQLKSNLRNRITSRVYLKQLSKHEGPISALLTLPDNEHVVSASQNALKLWNLKKSAGGARIGAARQVNSLLALSNERIISTANDGSLKVWNVADVIKDEDAENHVDSNQIQALALVADGSQLITIGDDAQHQSSHHHNVKIWDKSDVIHDSAPPLGFDIEHIDKVAFSSNSKQAISIRGKRLMVRELPTGKIY